MLIEVLKIRRISAEVGLRALAIMAITAHHAWQDGVYSGGTSVLLLLSGMAFARFNLGYETRVELLGSAKSLILRIWFPCLLVVLFSVIFAGRWHWQELLFVSNWWPVSGRGVAQFQIWFPEVVLQLLLGWTLLVATPLGTWLARADRRWLSLGLLVLAIVCREVLGWARHEWAAAREVGVLPFDIAWNFFLGVVWYFWGERNTTRSAPVVRGVLVIGSVLVVVQGYAHDLGQLRFLITGVLILAMVPEWSLPRFVVHALRLVGAACFAIFLTHLIGFRVLQNLLALGGGHDVAAGWFWGFGVGFGVGIWVVALAFVRTMRASRRQGIG